MATLKELIEKHGYANANEPEEKWPKYMIKGWPDNYWFAPFFKDFLYENKYYGIFNQENEICNKSFFEENAWELYTPPKKKVKRYAWERITYSDGVAYNGVFEVVYSSNDAFIRVSSLDDLKYRRVPEKDYEIEAEE